MAVELSAGYRSGITNLLAKVLSVNNSMSYRSLRNVLPDIRSLRYIFLRRKDRNRILIYKRLQASSGTQSLNLKLSRFMSFHILGSITSGQSVLPKTSMTVRFKGMTSCPRFHILYPKLKKFSTCLDSRCGVGSRCQGKIKQLKEVHEFLAFLRQVLAARSC